MENISNRYMTDFLINSIVLGIGLAMDAFSVSMANGLSEPKMKRGRVCVIALVYAFFQYLMPVIGWGLVHTVAEQFTAFYKVVPWIALVLLLFIGGKMLLEGLADRKRPEEEKTETKLTNRLLIVQGIATSIDALSVGFTIASYGFVKANLAALIIGAVTFLICVPGLLIGKKAGTKLSWRASVFGGILLMFIGIKIFIG